MPNKDKMDTDDARAEPGVGLLMSHTSNQPTNQPVVEYISIRVNLDHDLFDEFRASVLHALSEFIAYPHVGKGKDNPHFHILVPAGQIGVEAFRKRLKGYYKSGGNKCYSLKPFTNGLTSGIQYSSREGTDPIVHGDRMPAIIASAPAWVPNANIGAYLVDKSKKRPIDDMHHYTITFRNIEKLCLSYRQRKGIKSMELEVTLEAMHADNYRLDRQLTERGIPATVFDEFTAACKGGTSWTQGRFLRMRVAPTWMSI